jgi:hypothetical protein|tara:strand:- start:1582 stop:2118 length:537 start_codon:yes stop_codon:yes gene_type:complete
MALFGSARDASLIRSVNRELINEFIDTEVALYKLSLGDSATNIYDESDSKVYYSPIRINSIIQKDDKTVASDDFGIDSNRTGIFAFLRDDLVEVNIHIEGGDVIEYDNEFYEIDSVHGSQYWTGRNPGTDLGFTLGDRDEFGLSVAIRAEGHLTRRNGLNIREVRFGINKTNTKPKNL